MNHSARARFALVAALLCPAGLGATAGAAPSPVRAFVVWASPSRVYLAAGDSAAIAGALAPGARLTFVDGKRTIATGEATEVVDGELVLARLTSGSFARVRHLDRVRVLSERPPLTVPPRLRAGYPSRLRASLLIACGAVSLVPPSTGGYRLDLLPDGSARLARAPGASSGDPPWPDTLSVRWFDEVADEEIALERGELDLAVFWPGELSTRMREDPRWQGSPAGRRARGLLAALQPAGSASDAAADSADLAALDRELFRGDLEPWPAPGAPSRQLEGGMLHAAHFEIDPAIPDRAALDRFLNLPGRQAGLGIARIACLDVPLAPPDSLARALDRALRPLGPAPAQRVSAWCALRCPVVCAAGLRPLVAALGADTLVDLLRCAPAERKP